MFTEREDDRASQPRKGAPSLANKNTSSSENDSDDDCLRDDSSLISTSNDDSSTCTTSDSDAEERSKSSGEEDRKEEERHPRNETDHDVMEEEKTQSIDRNDEDVKEVRDAHSVHEMDEDVAEENECYSIDETDDDVQEKEKRQEKNKTGKDARKEKQLKSGGRTDKDVIDEEGCQSRDETEEDAKEIEERQSIAETDEDFKEIEESQSRDGIDEDTKEIEERHSKKETGEHAMKEEKNQSRNEVLDAYERRVLKRKQTDADAAVDLLHFPSGLEMKMALATDEVIPENEPYPMAFRAKRGGPSDVPRALEQALRRGPPSVCDVLESNARLVEWSDGSHTVMVGDEHYLVYEDKLDSDFYLFRTSEDVQTFEASVKSVGHLQPCNLDSMSAQIADSKTNVRGSGEVRTIMRTLEEGGEQEENRAKEEADRKKRDRARHRNKSSQNRIQEVSSPVPKSIVVPNEDEIDQISEEQSRIRKRRRTKHF